MTGLGEGGFLPVLVSDLPKDGLVQVRALWDAKDRVLSFQVRFWPGGDPNGCCSFGFGDTIEEAIRASIENRWQAETPEWEGT